MSKRNSSKWSNKRIQKFFVNNRKTLNDLYFGEKTLLEKYLKNQASVLDIGCGMGGFRNILIKLKKNIKYSGLDFNENMILKAKKKYSSSSFYHYEGNKYEDFFSNKFDYVLIFGILHLNNNWKEILKNAKKIAKKGIFFDIRSTEQKTVQSIKKSFFQLGYNKNIDVIPYNIINSFKFKKFLLRNFKEFDINEVSYVGKPSKFAHTPFKKVNFENYFLKRR